MTATDSSKLDLKSNIRSFAEVLDCRIATLLVHASPALLACDVADVPLDCENYTASNAELIEIETTVAHSKSKTVCYTRPHRRPPESCYLANYALVEHERILNSFTYE